jgi:hypothetical protein
MNGHFLQPCGSRMLASDFADSCRGVSSPAASYCESSALMSRHNSLDDAIAHIAACQSGHGILCAKRVRDWRTISQQCRDSALPSASRHTIGHPRVCARIRGFGFEAPSACGMSIRSCTHARRAAGDRKPSVGSARNDRSTFNMSGRHRTAAWLALDSGAGGCLCLTI